MHRTPKTFLFVALNANPSESHLNKHLVSLPQPPRPRHLADTIDAERYVRHLPCPREISSRSRCVQKGVLRQHQILQQRVTLADRGSPLTHRTRLPRSAVVARPSPHDGRSRDVHAEPGRGGQNAQVRCRRHIGCCDHAAGHVVQGVQCAAWD